MNKKIRLKSHFSIHQFKPSGQSRLNTSPHFFSNIIFVFLL
jgi:hypothetical protein